MKYLVVLCLMLFGSLVGAQDDLPPSEYVFESEQIVQFRWSADGTELQITEAVGQDLRALTYTSESQQVQISNTLVSVQEIDTSDINNIKDPYIIRFSKPVFLSPNGQWAVYGVTTGEPEKRLLALHNLETREIRILNDVQTLGSISHAHLFHLVWSADSSAFFVYTTNGPVTYWYYVGKFAKSLDGLKVITVDASQGSFADTIPGFGGILAIDPSGMYLLIKAFRTARPQRSETLVIVNMTDLTYTELLTVGSLKAATFSSQDEGKIYYISDEGMLIYTVDDDKPRLLNPWINATWIFRVEISPDGRYVAVLDSGPPDKLYVISVNP